MGPHDITLPESPAVTCSEGLGAPVHPTGTSLLSMLFAIVYNVCGIVTGGEEEGVLQTRERTMCLCLCSPAAPCSF